jgi:5-methylcytosine-specific restriction endonuclease McrA
MRKGTHHTEKSKQKNRKSNLGNKNPRWGMHLTEGIKRKVSDSLSGDKNPNYRHGKRCWDKTLHPYIAQYEFEVLQEHVENRDRHKCQKLGRGIKHTTRLSSHHIVPLEVGYKSRICDDESNLIILCDGCHHKVHGGNHSDHWKEYLPEARKYLSKFGYPKLLLDKYL